MEYKDTNNLIIHITAKDTKQRIEKIEKQSISINNNADIPTIRLERDKKRQKILGFGGAFTEASSSVYDKLNNEKQDEIIDAYFGENGNGYTMGRSHINSCDFSLGNYAYCDTPGDKALNNFDISRDKRSLIPFIKSALQKADIPIHIMASPWSPPAWMKTNGQMNHGGKLKDKFRSTWAEYYCRYIESYEKVGVPIWGLSVQNEPDATQTWDSCIYSSEEERDFIKNYLGPALQKNKLTDKKLIIWDHNRDIMLDRARTVLNDSEAAKYVWGTGFHWYNGDHFDAVQQVHDEFPDKQLIFTEGCQEGGPHIGSWELGERYGTSIIHDLNRWTVAWIDWNLILDENGGPNHVGNFCSAPIIVDTQSKEILYQSSYFYLGHFSRFIKRGDWIINSESQIKDLLVLAAVNNLNITTTVIMNKKDHTISFNYHNGESVTGLKIPARSIITIIEKPNH